MYVWISTCVIVAEPEENNCFQHQELQNNTGRQKRLFVCFLMCSLSFKSNSYMYIECKSEFRV